MKKYQKHNRRYFAGALFSILISTVFAVSLQFFKGKVLDHASIGEIQPTAQYAVLLMVFILCEVLGYFCYDLFSAGFVAGCTRELKQDIFESILNRSYVAYRAHPQGEYLAKYTSEADTIRDQHFRLLPVFWEILFKTVLVSAGLLFLDLRIAVITIALLTTPLYIPKLIERRLQNAQSAHIRSVEDSLTRINDWLCGFELIKNYSIERSILTRFRAVNNITMETLLKQTRLGAVSQLISTLISYLSYFTVLAYAAWLVLKGEFSGGDFFVAIGMIDQLSYPLVSLAGIIRQLLAIKPVCTAMEEFLRLSPSVEATERVQELKTGIQFQDVSFSYDGQRYILNGFDLAVQKGKRYLIKGPSGCGKTTTINLLLNYYKPDSGCIEIDGVPIGRLTTTYNLITVVRQDPVLFHDTLRNNLTMYREIPEERLLDVLRRVGLERCASIQALDSEVCANGANFSGGERKRLCLARALLRDTDILILDEPLANLDPAAAEHIEDLLLTIEDKTLLIVSHQFSQGKLHRFHRVIDFSANAQI